MNTFQKLSLAFALLVALVACEHMPVEKSPAREDPKIDIEGFIGPGPEPVEHPGAPTLRDGCVGELTAKGYARKQGDYHHYLAHLAVTEWGWRPLADVVTVKTDKDWQMVISPVEIADSNRERIIDEDGNRWLAMTSWKCKKPRRSYYIDQNLKVYSVSTAAKCTRQEIPGCGTFDSRDCPREPRVVHRQYVRVPSGATRGQDQVIGVEADRCFEIVPQGGYQFLPY